MNLSPSNRIVKPLIVSVAIAGLLSLPLAVFPNPAEAVAPGYNGKIVFYSSRDGNAEIYIMDADGSQQKNLTRHPASDGDAAWSQDGGRVVFTSDRTGNQELFTMNADGSELLQLTSSPGYSNIQAAWSPSGDQLVFVSNRDGSNEIYVMNADGTNPTRLTTTTEYEEHYPTWSPDGTEIAASRFNLSWSASTLVIMNVDGSNQQEFDFSSQGIALVDAPNWSPDGEMLLFTGYHESNWETFDQYIVNADGTNLTQITNDGVSGYGSGWLSLQNTPPVANSNTLTTPYNTSGIADILANDTDEEALDPANLTITSPPSHSTAVIVDGKVKFTPNDGYSGSDQLTYQICDSFMLDQKCATGVLSITVQAPDAPAVSLSKIGSATMTNGTTKYTSDTARPTFSGTATPGATIRVEIHSEPIILTTTADNEGNWSVTPDQDLPVRTITTSLEPVMNLVDFHHGNETPQTVPI